MSITVVLPLPPGGLSPNSRPHWGKKARAVKQYRTDAGLACRAAMNAQGVEGGWVAASVLPVFYHASRRRRDADNHGAALKAAYDGLVDAGLLVDDEGLVPLPVRFEIDKADPRVELLLIPGDWVRQQHEAGKPLHAIEEELEARDQTKGEKP